jgi:transcriptional regulator with XRE-family HTH domain
MPKQATRTYSRITRHAATLLGKQIRIARKERKITAQELADRAGISRGLLQRIEKGDLKCQIGAVFEVAALIGIKLFDADELSLATRVRQADDKIALLPKHIHPGKEASQAMLISGDNRMSRISACLEAAHHFLLSEKEAAAIVEHQISAIGGNWSAVCEEADLTETDRSLLWGRQFLNAFAFDDLEGGVAQLAKNADDVRDNRESHA